MGYISLIVLGVIFILISVLIIQSMKKSVSGTKLMLLGISIIIFGGILVLDPDTSIGGIEYLITLIGLVFVFFGFGKKD